jgi:hypothetical protein
LVRTSRFLNYLNKIYEEPMPVSFKRIEVPLGVWWHNGVQLLRKSLLFNLN